VVKSQGNPDPPLATGTSVGSSEVKASIARTESASTNEAAASSGASTSGSAEQTGNGHQHASTPRSVTNLSSSDNNGQRKERSGVQNGSRNGNNGSQNGTQNGTQSGSQKMLEGAGGAASGGGFEGGSTSDNGRETEYRPSAENMKGADWMSSTLAQARLESHYSVSPALLLFRCLRIQLLFLWLSWPCHQYIVWYSNLSLAPEQGTCWWVFRLPLLRPSCCDMFLLCESLGPVVTCCSVSDFEPGAMRQAWSLWFRSCMRRSSSRWICLA
jgi:hypothetical protein